jgi:hypothetical protein
VILEKSAGLGLRIHRKVSIQEPAAVSQNKPRAGTNMAYYRLYGLGHGPRIQDVVEVICSDDSEALAAAHQLLERFARVEVWELSRKVATIQLSTPSEHPWPDEPSLSALQAHRQVPQALTASPTDLGR